MKSIFKNKYLYIGIGIILIFVIWEILYLIFRSYNVICFPNISDTFNYLFNELSKSFIYKCLGLSLFKMIIGFSIGFVLSLIFGIISGNSVSFKNMMLPLITVIKAIPTACVIFIFLIMAGSSNAPILLVIIVVFPIMYESIVRGIEELPREIVEASKLDSTSKFKKIMKIDLPVCIPYILVGMASSFNLALKIEIMAEVISGSTTYGIGSLILNYQRNNPGDLTGVFAYSIFAIFVIFLINILCSYIIKEFKK